MSDKINIVDWINGLDESDFDEKTVLGIDSEDAQKLNTGRKVKLADADVTITVGSGGDFSTIEGALNKAKEYIAGHNHGAANNRTPDISVEIRLLDGFVVTEQLFFINEDFRHVTIQADHSNNVVTVQRSSLTENFIDSQIPFIGANNSVLPSINCIFEMDTSGSATERVGLYMKDNSSAYFFPNAGIRNSGDNNVLMRGCCSLVAAACDFTGAGRTGIETSERCDVMARQTDVSNCDIDGFRFDSASNCDVRNAVANDCGVNGLNIARTRCLATGIEILNSGDRGVVASWGSWIHLGSTETAFQVRHSNGNDIHVDRASVIEGLGWGDYLTTRQQPNIWTDFGIVFDHTKPGPTILEDVTVIVGPEEFEFFGRINDAIEFLTSLKRAYKQGSVKANINLTSGFNMSFQVLVRNQDLSWITITSDQSVTTIQRSNLSVEFEDGTYPAFGADNASLPVIDCQFEMDTGGSSSDRHGAYIKDGSKLVIQPNGGIRNSGESNVRARASRVIAAGCDLTGAGAFGCDLDESSLGHVISTDFSNSGVDGLRVDGASSAKASNSTSQNNGRHGVSVFNASSLDARNITFGGNSGQDRFNDSAMMRDDSTLHVDDDDKASLSGANFTDMPQVGGVEIVASGSNSDGEWIRFADGTQIVNTIYINLGPGNNSSGNLFRTNPAVSIDYPLSFTEIPTVSVNAERTGSGNSNLWGLSALNKENSIDALEKAMGVRCLAGSTTSNDIEARVTAIGRWF